MILQVSPNHRDDLMIRILAHQTKNLMFFLNAAKEMGNDMCNQILKECYLE